MILISKNDLKTYLGGNLEGNWSRLTKYWRRRLPAKAEI